MGGKPTPQPSQKYFESLLLQRLQGFELTQPVWVEAEKQNQASLSAPDPLAEDETSQLCRDSDAFSC